MIQTYKSGGANTSRDMYKHQLTDFSDASQSKTVFKMRPKYIYKDTPFVFIPPTDETMPVYFRQVFHIPINRRHAVGIDSELFRRPATNLQTLGLYYEYTNIHDFKLRLQGKTGVIPSCKLQYHKLLGRNKIVSLYYSSALNLKDIYSSLGIGFKYKNFQAVVSSRLGFGQTIRMHYKQPIYKGLYVKFEASFFVLPSTQSEYTLDRQVSLNYYFSKVKCSLIGNYYNPHSARVQFQLQTSLGKISICNQYVEEQNIIYLGLRRHNCQFSIPIAASNSLAVGLLFGVAYFLGLFLRKDKPVQIKTKTQQTRIEELRLIEERAYENYKREDREKGLKIEYAYYGQEENILGIKNLLQKQGVVINHSQLIKEGEVIEVTVPIRYYTQKGKLKLPKNRKSHLLAFCDIPGESKLLLAYRRGVEQQLTVRMFGERESVEI